MNREFLKEAIADAKTVKESAIANAKIALEESFAPRIQSMLSAKLEEMDKEEMDEEMDDKVEEVNDRQLVYERNLMDMYDKIDVMCNDFYQVGCN